MKPEWYAQIIDGGAVGVDTIIHNWCKIHNVDNVEYKPNYKVYGDTAPYMRDKEMVEASDAVIAFWDGKSHGTNLTIEYAKFLGIPYKIHLILEKD